MHSAVAQWEAYLAKTNPALLKKCYPRRIVPPSGDYLSPRIYGLFMAAMIHNTGKKNAKSIGGVEVTCNALYRQGVPTYFVARDLAYALAHTDMAEDLKFKDVKMPGTAMLFALPLSFSLKFFEGYQIPFIGMALYERNDVMRIAIHYPVFRKENGEPMDFGCMWNVDDLVTNAIKDEPRFETANSSEELKNDYEIRHSFVPANEDRMLAAKGISLLVKILMAMTARPELLEKESIARPAKEAVRKQKEQEELWNPNVIGRKYQFVRTGKKSDTETAGSSPRGHFRRGHWRNQAYGKGWSEHKVLWIDPILVLGGYAEK